MSKNNIAAAALRTVTAKTIRHPGPAPIRFSVSAQTLGIVGEYAPLAASCAADAACDALADAYEDASVAVDVSFLGEATKAAAVGRDGWNDGDEAAKVVAIAMDAIRSVLAKVALAAFLDEM